MVADSVRGRSTLWYRSISAAGAGARRPAGRRGTGFDRGRRRLRRQGQRQGTGGWVAAAGAKTLDGANDTGAGRTRNRLFIFLGRGKIGMV